MEININPTEFLMNWDDDSQNENLKKAFKKNDISTRKSDFDPSSADEFISNIYIRSKQFFCKSWCKKMREMGGRGSFKNFSDNDPIKLLCDTQGDFICGTVMTLIDEKPDFAFDIIEQSINDILNYHEDEFCELLFERMESKGFTEETLTEDDITEEDILFVLDILAEKYMVAMLSKYMQAQNVPELIDLLSNTDNRTIEDFSNAPVNYDRDNYNRDWNQTRRKDKQVKSITSLENLSEEEHPADDSCVEETIDKNEDVIKLHHFISTLNETDAKIMQLRILDKSQAEIAEALGCTQSKICKRLKSLKKKYLEFEL